MNIEERKEKRLPFTVPDGYFNTLPDKILARVQMSQATKIRPIATTPIRTALRYAAAIVMLFMAGGYMYYNDISSLETNYAYNEGYSSDYFDDLYESLDIDDYTLYSYLTSNDIDF